MTTPRPGLGGLPARRIDQITTPPPPAVAPQSNVGRFRVIIITGGAGSGIFVYSPSPGPGNLIGSWAGAAGVDQYGNAYPAGLNVKLGTITGTAISAGTITGTDITAGTITGTDITGSTITASEFDGTDFTLGTSGLFIYSGTPAAGNLIASAAPAAGSDAFGNAYVQGFGSYGNPGPGPQFSQVLAGIFSTGLFSDTTPASFSGIQGEAILNSGAQSILDTPNLFRMFSQSGGNFADFTAAILGLYAAPDTPSLGVSGFNAMSLVHGWTNSGSGPPGQYRKVVSPGNSIELIGDLASGTQADATVIATLPGAYSPLHSQAFPCAFPGNINNEPAPRLSLNPSGQLQCNGISGMPAGQRVAFHWFISLDA